jgi:hypothetical protein
MGMADKPNRRAAAAAARELLRPKLDRITEIAEAARTIELAVQARDAANRHILECQQAYARARRDALDAGWTEAQLLQLGWGPATTHDQRRRRSSARSRTTRPPVSGSPQSPTSAALEHPETEQEWANVIDGPLSTPQPDHAAGTDRGDGGAAFVDAVQAGTIG